MLVESAEDLGAAVRARRQGLALTQAGLAARAGVSRQWIVEVEAGHPRAELGRVLDTVRVLGLELQTREIRPRADRAFDGMLPPPALSRAVRKEVEAGDTGFALRLIGRSLHEFRHLPAGSRARFLGPPASTGDHRWDTLIAAAFRRECRLAAFDSPAWVAVEPLGTWWFPVTDRVLVARTMQRTPIDFKVLGIWLDAKALEVA